MTEIVHSETLPDGSVKVYIEKPDEKARSADIIGNGLTFSVFAIIIAEKAK